MNIVEKISDRLNEKKFMHRGEDDIEEEREYGVSFVSILHELQKTYNWKRNFGLKQRNKIQKEIIDVDAEETKKPKNPSNMKKQKSEKKMNVKEENENERKMKKEKKPIMNEKVKEKREFKNQKKEKKDKKKKVIEL